MILTQPKLIASSMVFIVAVTTPILIKTINIESCLNKLPFTIQFLLLNVIAFGLLSIFITIVKAVVRMVNSKTVRPGGDFPK